MFRYYSNDAIAVYTILGKCIMCTVNGCSGTTQSGTVKLSTLHLDTRAAICFINVVLTWTAFLLPDMMERRLKICLRIRSQGTAAILKTSQSFLLTAGLLYSGTHKHSFVVTWVPARVSWTSYSILQNLYARSIINSTSFCSDPSNIFILELPVDRKSSRSSEGTRRLSLIWFFRKVR